MAVDRSGAEAVDIVLRWVLQMPGPDGSPVSAVRGCEAAFFLSREARLVLESAGVGPEQIALPLGNLVELLEDRQERLRAIVAEVPAAGVICARGQLDGATTIAQAARMAQEFANLLRGLANAGYELKGPVQDDGVLYSKP